MVDFNLIPFFKDLLVRAVPTNTFSFESCVLKGWFQTLGIQLGFKSMRLFIYKDSNASIIVRHVYGDKEFWKNIDPSRLKKEKTLYKNLYFVKIRHIRENGNYLTLGYLGFYTDGCVSRQLLDALDVLCMLYGNYIVKRLIRNKIERTNDYLSKVYSLATSQELPGTIILGVLDCIHKLSGFNIGVFCTVQERTLIPEYVVSSRSNSIITKTHAWTIGPDLYNMLVTSKGYCICGLSDLPRKIISFFLYKDMRSPQEFEAIFYPVFVDEDFIGLWITSYSMNNPFDSFSIKSLLDNLYPKIYNNYKYLFQRRFQKMIVNPVFNGRNTRILPNSVFVIMPFSEEWSDELWNFILKPAITELDMKPVRADDLYGSNVMEDIWNGILQAAVVICDTTGRNPNVFYELGIAHTLGKEVLLLSQNVGDIPFDLRSYRHIQYQATMGGGSQLKDKIQQHIQEALKRLASPKL